MVFIHGLWLLASSWDRWGVVFDEAGYAPVLAGWPDDPDTVEEGNEQPEVFAGKTVGQVADHYAEVIGGAGEEAGGDRPLLRRAADRDRGRAGPVGGLGGDRRRPLPRRAAAAHLFVAVGQAGVGQPGQPASRRPAHLRPVPLRFANAVSEEEARELYDTFVVPASGVPLFQAAAANLNPLVGGQG